MGCMLVSDLSNSAGLKHSLQLCLQLVVQQNPQQIEIMKYGSNSASNITKTINVGIYATICHSFRSDLWSCVKSTAELLN